MVQAVAQAAPRRPPEPAPARPTSRRIPALDWLRGFALTGMLLWHADVSWVQGGFVRMTIFFALSGFLATRSWRRILDRDDASGRFRTFWWRRARRLLPISYLGVGVAVATTVVVGTPEMRGRLGGDVLSVLGYVSNLRFWLSGQGYGELFTEPSLLQHYWTLSIEEQAFALLPLLLAGLALLVGPGQVRQQFAVVSAITVALVGLPVVVSHSADAVWYSSPIRIGEFCGGVALALWMAQERTPRFDRWLRTIGTASLAIVVGAVLLVPRDVEWLYRGGMGLFLLPTLGLLAAAARSEGIASTVLSFRPLVALGRWTFSIYVLHWPLFYVLDEARTGLDGWELATLRMGSAVALGAVLHVLVERPLMAPSSAEPVRTGLAGGRGPSDTLDRWAASWVPAGWWRTGPAAAALGVSAVTLAVVGFLPSGDDPYEWSVIEDRAIDIANMRMFNDDPGRIAVGIYGGSTATTLDLGGSEFFQASDELAIRPGVAKLGCGLVTVGERTLGWDTETWEQAEGSIGESCRTWPDTWPEVARISGADVALVIVGSWDTLDFTIDGETTHVGDPDFDRIVRRDLETAIDAFRAAGIEQVQFATTPVVGRGPNGRVWERRGLDDDHPVRVDAFNDLLRDVAGGHDDVAVVEYGAYVDSLSESTKGDLLPDGVHPTDEGAQILWESYLGEAVVAAYDSR